MGICQGPGCDRETERRYCDGHWKQLQRGGPLLPLRLPQSPLEAFLAAGSDWLEAEGDDEYRRAEKRVLLAGEAWLRSRGWRPPRAIPCQACPGRREPEQLQLPLRFKRPPPRPVHARAYSVA